MEQELDAQITICLSDKKVKIKGNYMFRIKKRLCSNCKTGKASLELDKHSETCPYISCYTENRCDFFEPLDKEKNTFWNKISGIFASRK